ncbi:MAG TPA: FliI/YscN family ATPase [Candidatus Saccharimonadales bacterium]|nr:FliI/YscN family ATPase [Candidatus Saccharimonadales bacterium]
MEPTLTLEPRLQRLSRLDPVRVTGRVAQVVGLVVEATGLSAPVGELCEIHSSRTQPPARAEVVGFREDRTLLMPLGDLRGVAPGGEVVRTRLPLSVAVGPGLLGRVVDGLGAPLDDGEPLPPGEPRPLYAAPPHPLKRARVLSPLATGVRAVDGFLTVGYGQRMGIFSGSGVGKSLLLGMMARGTAADVAVIALIGERGREVRDFLERDLGREGLRRSVVITSTSERPALVRVKAALLAATVAEHFRDQGAHVLLLMDSLTRVAMAQREVGLATGEPPTARGYTPSVFALLPQLLERSGCAARGSVTGIYTVLVEQDDMNDPIADAARSVLDGHVVLTRRLASANHYPAVDVLESVSRVMHDVADPEHRAWAAAGRRHLAVYRDSEDLVQIGAYVKGSNADIDAALEHRPRLQRFLQQAPDELTGFQDTRAQLCAAVA